MTVGTVIGKLGQLRRAIMVIILLASMFAFAGAQDIPPKMERQAALEFVRQLPPNVRQCIIRSEAIRRDRIDKLKRSLPNVIGERRELSKKEIEELKAFEYLVTEAISTPFPDGLIGHVAGKRYDEAPTEIVQIIDDENVICEFELLATPDDPWFWISGVNTRGLKSELGLRTKKLFVVSGTVRYQSLSGLREIPKLVPFDMAPYYNESILRAVYSLGPNAERVLSGG